MKNILLVFLAIYHFSANSQNTVGLIEFGAANADGYVLFSPITSTKTYLIDKCGEKVHEWNTSTYSPGLSCVLLHDGSLLRSGRLDNPNFNEGGSGGILEKFDWDGNLTWSYEISDVDLVQHHDFKVLPNGNILVIAWDRYTNIEALAQGKNTSYTNAYLWSEKIVEIEPVGTNSANIVWEWKLWDHLIQDFDNTKPNYGVVSEHPELIDLNYFPGQPTSMDWIHLNSIDYNPSTDQIMVSSHTLCEIWVIDHSTTTNEAALHTGGNSGKGGDILYRWGNPQAYDRGTPATKVFFGQHHATWIPQGMPNEGKIIVFNNGLNRPGTYSSIDMIEPPVDGNGLYTIDATNAFLPTSLFWTYTAPVPSDFYSSNISSVFPLNGSFMITSGANGEFFELDVNEQRVWTYVNPVTQTGITQQGSIPGPNPVFRAEFYPSFYPAFIGKTMTPLGEIELNPTAPSICEQIAGISSTDEILSETTVYPNPFNDIITIDHLEDKEFEIKLTDSFGRTVLSVHNSTELNLTELCSGMYTLSITLSNGANKVFKLVK
jgi:hypothetical protein